MVWVGRDPKDHLIPTPLPWAGTLPLEQIPQSPCFLCEGGQTLEQEPEGREGISILGDRPHLDVTKSNVILLALL